MPVPSPNSHIERDYKIWQVISASAVGTMIEWYDFYIFGSLATVISPLFYPKGNDTLALIAYLSTFAVGFVVRPFGALFFGRIGDIVGRKYAFLVTLLIMGGATALIGVLPTYATIGIAAPIILLLIRILQGLALGGEYGGAAVYVAEHVPDGQRGFYTSFIQITATLGLFLSLAVILVVQNMMSAETFREWGWRVPFLISIVLVAVSLYIRLRMKESPIFTHIKSTGMQSAQPLKEAFTRTGQPETRVDLALRSDRRPGRGVVHGAVLRAVLSADDPERARHLGRLHRCGGAAARDAVLRRVRRAVGPDRPQADHDGRLPDRGAVVHPDLQGDAGGRRVERRRRRRRSGIAVTGAISLTPQSMVNGALQPAPEVLPYDGLANLLANPVAWQLILLIFIQVIFVTMVYGPIAAYLVEAFPAKIRYTALSLPYHIGNGVFGGLLPLIGVTVVAETGNIYAGLYYPIAVALADIRRRVAAPARDAQHVDLGRSHRIVRRAKGLLRREVRRQTERRSRVVARTPPC